MKNWQNLYEEKLKKHKGWGLKYVVYGRILRFKINPPTSKEHIDELEFLITNYDYHKTLLRRYEHVISDEAKQKWLDKFYEPNGSWHNVNHNLHTMLIPFYLINPKANADRINKDFLNDQIIMSLNCLDHEFKKYRWRANYLLEFLPLKFLDLKPNIRIRIIEVLSKKSTRESIKQINRLVFKYRNDIHPKLILQFVTEQIKRKMISDRMAILYLRSFSNQISSDIKDVLIGMIENLEDGEIIIETIEFK